MPEMPEVEQVRKTLAPHIEGKKILAVEIYLERLIKYPQPDAFIKGLVGKTISSVGRRGKYLVLHTAPKQQPGFCSCTAPYPARAARQS